MELESLLKMAVGNTLCKTMANHPITIKNNSLLLNNKKELIHPSFAVS